MNRNLSARQPQQLLLRAIGNQDMKSHCRDETILRPSYLHNGISYTGKMASLYWIGAQNVSTSLNKNSVFSAFWQLRHYWFIKFCTHHSFYWSSVKSLPANYCFIHSNHFRVHLCNIRQCQLRFSWLAMVTCDSRRYCECSISKSNFDFNALHMELIFKSKLMVINWHKNEIAHYFHKWSFYFIFITREQMWIQKRLNVGKGIRRNSHAI